MKTKIMLLIGGVAILTLSFTFANVEPSKNKPEQRVTHSSSQIGGLVSDEVVK